MKSIVTVLILVLSQPYSIHSQCISFRNTMYKLSATNCGQRCAERNVKNPTCTSTYSSGCFCKPGYYRDSTWNCVPGQECDHRRSHRSDRNAVANTTPKPDDCPPNEVYSECGNYCTEKCRNTNDKYCPQNICDVGCFCVDGYFRSEDGECVPQPKCGIKLKERNSAPPIVCPYGEHYEKCALRCAEICGVSKRRGCRGEKCEPGCFCKEGYARNMNGECVYRKNCKNAGSCKRHEEFRLCGNRCAELCEPPDVCPDKCKPGCFCKKGYLRNHKRKCVSDGDRSKSRIAGRIKGRLGLKCPAITGSGSAGSRGRDRGRAKPRNLSGSSLGSGKCGQNEIMKKCGGRCGESCDTLGKEYVCPLRKICLSGCFCEKGFYRNAKNKCVTPDKCNKNKNKGSSKELDRARKKLKKSCDPDKEEYKECGNHCVELCNPPTVCPSDCEFGCFCNEGLFRDSDGLCVSQKKCPALPKPPPKPKDIVKCGKGEKYFECKKDCILNCAEIKDKMVCPTRQKCLHGCLCIKGQYRDATGECVLEKLCSANSGPPEPRKKKNQNRTKQNIPDCNKNEGYLTCGNYCIEMCKPAKKCPKKCQSGCFCNPKYFRNNKGVCVRESKCEGKRIYHKIKLKMKDKCTGPNEDLKDCGYNCGQTCAEQAKHLVCPKRMGCTPGCFCTPGHFRNRDGVCVSIKDCKPKVGKFKPKTTTPKPKPTIPECPENELYEECGDHCIELCKPPDSCEAGCESGCFCEPGFYRPKRDVPCIPEEQCPKEPETVKYKMKIKLKCEDNEIYNECGTRCGQMCVDLFKSVICPKKGLCVGGCFCKPGYYRTEKGKCVIESQCPDTRPKLDKPPLCDENEEFQECGHRCQQSCETYLKKSECPSKKCSPGCFCKEGFYKDQYGNCVDPKDCTDPSFPSGKPETCGDNEKYAKCGNRCGQTCEELTQNVTCSGMRSCVSGCFCDKGFRRNDNGLCVPEDDCYKIKTHIKIEIRCADDNEEYSKCEIRCGQSCDDLGRKVDCPKSRQCASGCFCKEGHFRNEIGDCVPESECPDVGPPDQIPKKIDCGPNEEYNECGTRCGQGCEDLGRKTPCPKRRICISGCFCNEGTYRNYAGECVPMLECPEISPPKRPPPSCDSNEEYNDCGKRCGQSCDDFKNEKKCPKKQVCVLGCFCESDFRRDHNGDCVQEDTCPARDRDELNPESVNCGKNEGYSECGTRCGQGCEDLLLGQTECPKRRLCVSGCFCSEGFYRNEIGECVAEGQCPKPPSETKSKECGENERYTDCGSQCGQTCDDIANPVSCPRKRMCIAGCFCKKGFFRDKYDNCVSQRLCKSKDRDDSEKKKKTKASTTEKPDDEEEHSEDITESGTDEPHSEDDPDHTEAPEDDTTEGTEEDTTEHPTEAPDNRSQEDSDSDNEHPDDGSTEEPDGGTKKPVKNMKKDGDETDDDVKDKPIDSPEDASAEDSETTTKETKDSKPEESSPEDGSAKEDSETTTKESEDSKPGESSSEGGSADESTETSTEGEVSEETSSESAATEESEDTTTQGSATNEED